jgi:translation initiation factor eIF-2B subunit alpha/methylthioribose-1-phosphate isomerase
MKVRGEDYRAVWMRGRDVVVIDQRLLPHRFKILRLKNHRETAEAIGNMTIRGAGTIGATAGYGLAQASLEGAGLKKAYRTLLNTRPTAADLKHALDRVMQHLDNPVAEANRIADEYVERMKLIAGHGLPLIKSGSRVLTHCNAGWLAIVDWGSATAPIYLAHRKGRKVFVWVDETRPRCQGASLTSWEFLNEGVPHKVIADNAAGFYMRRGEVDLCIVGADRIAANGDAANKIGTYEKAVLARENGIPFYIAAPTSTIDLKCKTGDDIPIEERDEDEVHCLGEARVTPVGARAGNPAFDVTPARYITGIITERGICDPADIGKWLRNAQAPRRL